MAKDAAITVRIPLSLKRRLAQRARREHRSISAQVLHELERAVAEDRRDDGKPALGMFARARLPSDEDFRAVRSALWARLGDRDG